MMLASKLRERRRSSQKVNLSQEVQFLREAERFRQLAESSWDEKTIHPRSDFIAGKSNGHCGVTNFGFGIWLAMKSIIAAESLSYVEGRIVRPNNNELIGGDHAFLQAVVSDGCQHDDLCIRTDLAGDQFPGVDVPIAVQYEDYFYPDEQTPSGNRFHAANLVTPITEYDVARFNGRLGNFMINVCNVANLGELPADYMERLNRWGLEV
jgi:hypothetical protein